MGDPSQSYTIDPFTIYASWCTVTYSAASNEPALDSAIFIFDDVTQTFTFLLTNDLSLAGAPGTDQKDYTITVTAIVDILEATADFTLSILDPCAVPARNQITHPVGPFEELSYIVGTATAQYDFLEISGGGFSSTVDVCDDAGIIFSALLIYETGDEVALDDSDGAIIFNADGTFTVFTDDNLLLGAHEIHITARLTAYPSLISTLPMVIPIEFELCHLTVEEWVLSSVVLPSGTGTDYQIENPLINYPIADCPFDWIAYTVKIFDSNGNDVTATTSDVTFDAEQRTFTIEPRIFLFSIVYRVEIVADLANIFTSASSSFEILH